MTSARNRSSSDPSFEGFILVGGRSRRMGSDKASLKIGGSTMLERAVAALRAAGASRVAAVASRETHGDIESVRDVFEGKGALGGIHSALAHAELDKVFILACDFPFISADLVRFLVEVEALQDEACVVPEQRDGLLQPLAAVYSKARCLAEAEKLLRNDSASNAVKALLDIATPKIVQFDEYSHLENSGRLLMNINTPEDLERALKIAERDGL